MPDTWLRGSFDTTFPRPGMSELRSAPGWFTTDSTMANPESEPNVQVDTDPTVACLLNWMLAPLAVATSFWVSSEHAAGTDALPEADDALLPRLERLEQP